jgi:hypothetical protein
VSLYRTFFEEVELEIELLSIIRIADIIMDAENVVKDNGTFTKALLVILSDLNCHKLNFNFRSLATKTVECDVPAIDQSVRLYNRLQNSGTVLPHSHRI